MNKNEQVHPPTWWFKVLSRIFPERCREIPEAKETHEQTNPRILLRQFAIIKERAYLQQFASGEDTEYFHTHPWDKGTIAIGLWGNLTERLSVGAWPVKKFFAPYFRYMSPNMVHQTIFPSKGHTSIFIGLGKKTDEKYYYTLQPGIHWTKHIKKVVKRI